MIDTKTQLTIKHFDNAVYTDYTNKAVNFGRDFFTIDIPSGSYLYVGYRKPINAIYFDHVTDYANELEMTLEYYNGSSWVEVTGLSDDTFGLKRSGFIGFDRDLEGQVEFAVDGKSLFWYRISLSDERLAMEVSGVNLVFANDYELLIEQPSITHEDYTGPYKSHILTHVAVRNEIIQKFRSKDYIKTNSNGDKEDINAWDLLNIEEVRQAAVCLALSKIYYNSSDSSTDVWAFKAKDYLAKYEDLISVASLTIDVNDNGLSDGSEVKNVSGTKYFTR